MISGRQLNHLLDAQEKTSQVLAKTHCVTWENKPYRFLCIMQAQLSFIIFDVLYLCVDQCLNVI